MPVRADWSLAKFEDGTLTVGMAPAVAVGGWSIQFQVVNRFGGSSGLITKSIASGYSSGVSGMALTNSGQGVFSVAIRSTDTSGLDYGVYSHQVIRQDSGFRTTLAEGYLSITP